MAPSTQATDEEAGIPGVGHYRDRDPGAVPTSHHVHEAIGEEAVGGEDRRRPPGRVWPVKLNTVVERGVNDHGWRLDDVLPAAEVIRRIDAELPCRGGSPC